MQVAFHTRKIILVGRSAAVIIPPHVLDAIHANVGDYLIWDLSAAPFAVLSRAPIPPYVVEPDKYFPDTSHPD